MEEDFPPGFRFYPTEEELVSFYLHNMLHGNRPDLHRVIPVIQFYDTEPWHLPSTRSFRESYADLTLSSGFSSPQDEREAHGGRPSRTTASGYWKATGSPSHVCSSDSRVIGVKKSLVFYKGKAPTGRKTKWKMNEYKAIEEEEATAIPRLRHEFSLCRVYVVSGSLRAFDRRPLEAVGKETQPLGDGGSARTAFHSAVMEARTSSREPGTSNSGYHCGTGKS